MKLFLFGLLISVLLVLGAAFGMGGWRPVEDPSNNPQVVDAAEWAAHTEYPDESVSIKIVSAEQQVVAGMKYKINVEVMDSHQHCRYHYFEIWDRFGDKSLADKRILSNSCHFHHH